MAYPKMPPEERTRYIVTTEDETLKGGVGASSPIPTIGAATTAVDQYRIVAVESTNLPEIGAAFSDVAAVAALSKVAEGGITDFLELEAAETALQALLLHDIVHILTFAPKVDFGSGLVSYIRRDRGIRTQFGFDLFSLAESRDWIIAPEFLRVQNGSFTTSTLPDSRLLGREVNSVQAADIQWSSSALDAINVAIESHGIPAYLTEPKLVWSRRGDGFAKRFYQRLRQPWDKAVGDVPAVVCTFTLPPLLAVVFDRLDNRADLKVVVRDLRDELAAVRSELRHFNSIVTQSTLTSEIEARVRRISESFDAIIPESRLSGAQRWQRRILSIQPLARQLVTFATGFLMNTGPSFEDALKAANGVESLVLQSGAIVNRTITAKTFAGLVNTDPIQSLVQRLEPSEIEAIERSIRKR